jgi:hypothetical protein
MGSMSAYAASNAAQKASADSVDEALNISVAPPMMGSLWCMRDVMDTTTAYVPPPPPLSAQ